MKMIYMHYQFQNCLYGERRDFSHQRTLRRSPFLVPRNFPSPVPHGRKTRHVPRAPRDRGDTTRQLHSDPRVQAQASSLLKSAPAGPRSPPTGHRSPPAGQDLHRPGPLDAGPAQIRMSPRLDPQTGRISRSRRRRPDPSTLPGPFDPVPALRGRATTSDQRRRITSGSPRPPKRRWERRRAE